MFSPDGTLISASAAPKCRRTTETLTKQEVEMEQDPVFNADESVRVQFLPEPCMYPGGPPSVLEPTPQEKKKRKNSQKHRDVRSVKCTYFHTVNTKLLLFSF